MRQTVAADAYRPLTSSDLDNRFSGAMLLSILLHAAFIFGVTFTAANPKLFENHLPPLDVVLVNAKTESKPLKPQVLAQANLDGGGDVAEDRQASSPLPASPLDSPAAQPVAEVQSRVQALEEQARQLLTQTRSPYSVATPAMPVPAPVEPPPTKPQPAAQLEPVAPRPVQTPKPLPPENRPPNPSPAPADLLANSLEMARLMAKIDQQWDAYQKRPRRADIGPSARESILVRYLEDWRMKVERIGNLNYPEAARRNHIYGTLMLTVEINADGSLAKAEIYRPSNSKILDAAAIKIVQMAAPFAPFSEEMRKRYDIVSFTRTWTFSRDDQLISQ